MHATETTSRPLYLVGKASVPEPRPWAAEINCIRRRAGAAAPAILGLLSPELASAHPNVFEISREVFAKSSRVFFLGGNVSRSDLTLPLRLKRDVRGNELK